MIRLALLLGLSLPALAQQAPPPDAARLIRPHIAPLRDALQDPLVLVMLTQQNRDTRALSEGQIIELDDVWRAEREADARPLIARVLSNPLSTYLTRLQAHRLGQIDAIFVYDLKGLNVGQSAPTSDYWQGDEAKFQETVPVGADAVLISEPEWLEAHAVWMAQLSITLVDDAGTVAGGVTFDINLTELERRRLAGLEATQ